MPGPLLVKPPPPDPNKSQIEHILELRDLSSIEPDLFTNAREIWRPPKARGVYGGAVIAQCLVAAFRTVPPPSPENKHAVFLPHSMHCYFVLPGNNTIPIVYAVERVREGRSFLTRTVQARQRGNCIFTTTISFMAEGSAGDESLEHGDGLPDSAVEALPNIAKEVASLESGDDVETRLSVQEAARNGASVKGPFVSRRFELTNLDHAPHMRRQRIWSKFKGHITSGIETHICALVFMSDSWFIGTVPLIHYAARAEPRTVSRIATNGETPKATDESKHANANTPAIQPDRQIGMMVSLDHTIYFHRPREIKADDWMFSEMGSPWAGHARGVAQSRILNKDGRLLATCVQEGLVRLKRDEPRSKM